MKKKIFGSIVLVLGVAFCYLFIGNAPRQEHVLWGANFSQKQVESLGLDWKETFLAILDDLGARRLKIGVHWDLVEPEKGKYYFEDVDWQMKELEQRKGKAILVIGMKTPRWPECHIPSWAQSKEEQQEAILLMIKEVVGRYQNSPALLSWQVENEPFFPFGQCPWVDAAFLKSEIGLVHSLDSSHPVVVSESGEGSLWIQAAMHGDIVGTTIYRKVWFKQLEAYIEYPFPPVFYWRKAVLVDALFHKEVIGVELQAEPWGPDPISRSSLEEQEKSMNLDRFRNVVEFAKNTGLPEQYFWGAEWWYWMKKEKGSSLIWDEAKNLPW
ncbi:MAG: hypothetical protein Q7S63_01725 [bacterium]|nr:hypothetical protein [bacterium]